MNIYKKLVVFTFVLLVVLGFAGKAYANVPTLYVSSTSANNVLISVTGDVNSSVTLYYNTSYGTQNTFLGYTNMSGYFSTTVSASSYNIPQGNYVYAVVNNQQSSSVVWPSTYSYNSTLTLSQTNVSLNAGQTSYVTANNTYGTLYVSTNSNSNVVTATVVGNSVSFYGVNSGSSTVVICQNSTSTYCGTVYVTVGGYNYNSTNTTGLIVSNLNLSVGNSITLTSPNNIGLYVSTNSNPSVASVLSSTLNGGCYGGSTYNTLNGQPCFYQTNNTGSVTISAIATGVSSVTLCQTGNTSACSVVNINVVGTGSYNNGSVLGASTCSFYRTLKLGMSGSDVSCLQSMLASKGYLVNSNYSSYFDLQTKNAVIIFQQDNYLYADGIVGRRTANLLYN